MATKKQVLLISAYATIIILAGMVIVLSQTARTTTVITPATMEPMGPPWPPGSPTTPETANPVIWAIVFLVFIAAIVLVTKGGVTQKAGAMGSRLGKMFSAGGKKFWTVMLLIGLYILILIGVYQLLPNFWHWFKEQGWFFLCWLLVGLPVVIAIINAKLKFSLGLGLVWLAITLFASDWKPVDDWIKAKKLASSSEIGASKEPTAERSGISSSRVTSRTIMAKPGVYSDRVSVPFSQSWSIEPEGRVKILTAGGKTWDDWPGKIETMRTDPSILDSMFQFMSLEEKEVKVTVVWEPR